ncbi:tetratricopeptide repeat protein [Chryseobacterium sp.]|uniref:tetratricopeptide repeat protein n=1 Tax=Chryseobacterium sp. TaxID=1871047 RepID=UPI002852BD01|nr:tetratricopeptide repeat protein [Chryseobacterium sp.]
MALFKYAEKLKNSKSTIHKALFYTESSQLESALNRLDKYDENNSIALKCVKKSKESWLKKHILGRIYFRKGNFFLTTKQYDKTLQYYREYKKIGKKEAYDNMIGYFYLYYREDLDSAKVHLLKAVKRGDLQNEKDYYTLSAYANMGEYYRKIQKYNEAEKMYLKALEVDKRTKRTFEYYSKHLYNALRSTYEEKGDKKKAYFYLKKFLATQNKSNISLLSAANQDMDEFILEADKNAQKDRNNVFTLILIGLTISAFLGIYSWSVINLLRQKKIKLKNEAEQLKEKMDNTGEEKSIELAKINDSSFLQVFREAYPGFIEKLLTIDPNLEDSELVFCAMLKLHFSSKEIAGYTSIQHRTVQQKKYRIRKKLNIPQDTDIYLFFDDLY